MKAALKDPRCWREVALRGGITAIMTAIAIFYLDGELWLWIFPVIVVAMTVLKWVVRPPAWDDEEDVQGEDVVEKQ
jgi:hypothetical protein